MKKQYYPLLSILAIAVFLFCNSTETFAQVKKFKSVEPTSLPTNCSTPPVLHCPTNYIACPGASTDPSVSQFATAFPGGPTCLQPIVSYIDHVIDTGICAGAKVIQRIWTAQDPDDPFLRAFCIQYLNTLDTTAPSITNCPRDTSILTNAQCMAQFNWDMPWITDECGNFMVSCSHINGGEFPVGNHSISITATDACSNTSICSFQLEVVSNCCINPPTITCPSDYISCPGNSIDPSITGRPQINKSSPACKNPLSTFHDRMIQTSNCLSIIERTWITVDPDNPALHAHCTQMITLEDLIPPTITFCPPNITVQSSNDCTAIVNWSNPTATDDCGTVSITTSVPSGWKFTLGHSAVNVIATDGCGNTASCEFLIYVEDNCCKNPPNIFCPADITTCPGTSIDPSVSGNASSTPGNTNCQDAIITFVDEINVISDCEINILRQWKATDPSNNNSFSTCVQNILLVDTIPPTFTFVPVSITVQSDDDCTAVVHWPTITAEDNCGFVNIDVSIQSGFRFTLGHTAIVAIATDACGNSTKCEFVVTVEANCCKKPPVITCPANYTDCPSADIQASNTGFATSTPGDPTCQVAEISFKDTIRKYINCVIELERSWTATVPGNPQLSSSCKQLIVLKDSVAPVISVCPPNITVQSNDKCTAIVNWTNPIATDDCGAVTIHTSVPSGHEFPIGTETVLVTATDVCANSSLCEFRVTVEENCCNAPPVLLCPSDFTACPGSSTDISETGVALVDPFHPVCQFAFITFSDSILSSDPCRYILQRNWKAENPKNNAASTCSQTIILEDTESPVIFNCPQDMTIDPQYNCNTNVQWNLPFADDNCGIRFILSTHQPGTSFTKGITRVVYTATDNCGNTSSCWFFITVTDKCCDQNPVISCPPDYASCPSSGSDPSVTGTATAVAGKADCLPPLISYTDSVLSMGPCPMDIKIERRWTATDPNISSLRSTCKQIIELKDTMAPGIQNMPHDISINAKGACDIPVFWTHPIAVDNCALNTIQSNYKPGARFADGINDVIYTATDVCGNISKDTFTINVAGTEVGIICPDDFSTLRTNPFINGAIVDWSTPKVNHCKPCKTNIPGFAFLGELDGHNYFSSGLSVNWFNAKQICEQSGGKLVIINSSKENKFISSKLNGQTIWLGATDETKPGIFEWLDKSIFSFSSWLPGQPDNSGGNEHFIEMLPDGNWNDQNGNAQRTFILEISCYELTQIEGALQGELLPCGNNKIAYVAQKDGKADTCSFEIHVDCEKESIYCNARGLDSRFMFIDRVEFAGIDSTTGDNGGFQYFNRACGKISPSNTYRLCVTPGYLGTKYKVYWKIWIDFNADGFYDPVTEEVVYGYGNTAMCAELTMPASLPSKQTRMRVAMSYTGYPVSPCSSPMFGEIEDYCILMNGATPSLTQDKSTALQFNPVKLQCAKHCEENQKLLTDELFDSEWPFELKNKTSFDVDLFPNPSSNFVSVISRTSDLADFEIYNHQGKMIYKRVDRPVDREFSFPVNEWPNGMYSILIFNSSGEQITKRFIVNR